MKHLSILVLGLALFALAGCKGEGKKTDLAIMEQADSLQKIISQKDNEINDMMETFNEIQEGLREINEAENRVSIVKDGEGADKHRQMVENIQFISNTMKQNRVLMAKLRQQLRESSIKGDELRKTVEELVKQLDAKDQQLNTAWFVFGTKKELKEQRIIDGNKVLEANFNKNYFTKIDIRVEKEVKLYSKSARILTMHPSSSYTLQRDANKQYVLRINNPQLFWSTSKYLVIVVK